MKTQYDVIIAGGGLAGLTLSIQLKMKNPLLSILVMEYRDTIAPVAAHKVGESTVELATHYFREVLNLKAYLEEFELPKHGLRFFFTDKKKDELSNRVELGPRLKLPTPSHQLDRGTFENFLEKHTISLGTEFLLGARVKDAEFGDDYHTIIYNHQEQEKRLQAKWLVDATSRFSLLKRKMKFQKEAPHNVNAVWYRVKGVVDIDEWSSNTSWQTFLEPRLRYLSTVHFMDKGYWLWVIPLGSKNTSIGIVADQDIHPFDTINTYPKAMEWIKKNEPQAYKHVCPPEEELLDFRILKHFAHDSERVYSAERWAVTGEAGAFLDPFYSPGSDFISLNNTWLSDLILRSFNGEDITVRTEIYEKTHLQWFRSWLPIYQDKYKLMGNSQIMVMKIFWDWAIYWSVPCLMFTNNGFTDIKLLRGMFVGENAPGVLFQKLNKAVQDLFLEWLPYEQAVFENKYIDPLDLNYLRSFQQGIEMQYNKEELFAKLKTNISILEKIAAEMFRRISNQAKGTDLNMAVNPYTISLSKEVEQSGSSALLPDDAIRNDIATMWFYDKEIVTV
jgi:flavin-dependent dehydrogenase